MQEVSSQNELPRKLRMSPCNGSLVFSEGLNNMMVGRVGDIK